MKSCKHCNEIKPLNEFTIDNRMKGGYTNLCKVCRNNERKLRYHSEDNYRTKELNRVKKYNDKALLRALNNVKELNDPYVIASLKRDTDLTTQDIRKYPELIKTKRQELIVKRVLKNHHEKYKRIT